MLMNVMKRATVVTLALATAWGADHPAKPKAAEAAATSGQAVLWSDPTDIATRNLFDGPGGKEHAPHAPFKFLKEDLDGTNPKFTVKDADGVKWKVKMGLEARPETTATRLVWAAGYFVNEDYFMRDLPVSGMPERLHRGWKLVDPDGTVHNVRLKREAEGEKKLGTWEWRSNPFTGTREWNGLRTLMALINNWDLKDVNNSIYRKGDERIYMVSDLGATFGSAGRSWPRDKAKDNMDSFMESKFIGKVTADTVEFDNPARPGFVYMVNPKEYLSRVRLEDLGKNVPRADAKWLGEIMARLSPEQIKDAFRAGGYSPAEVEGFTRMLQDRIAALTAL